MIPFSKRTNYEQLGIVKKGNVANAAFFFCAFLESSRTPPLLTYIHSVVYYTWK